MSEPITQNTNNESQNTQSPKKKFKLAINIKMLVIILGIFFLAVGVYFAKGLFVAALVNNRPVSRFAVTKELEKQGGKQTLENLVTKELIKQEISKRKVQVTQAEVDEEIKKIEDNVIAQGMTLEEVLSAQNYTLDQLKEELKFNKEVEKMIADKTAVSEEEITKYLEDNKSYLPADSDPATLRVQVADSIKQQKVSAEAQNLVTELKQNAKIVYFVKF